jgi:site-specific recombinase XerD
MASIKIVLRKNKNKDGSYPLTIRITKNRKTSWVYLNTNLFPEQWDATEQRVRKSHPNSTRLNNFLRVRLAEVSDKSLELETVKKETTSRTIRKRVVQANNAGFFSQAQLYLDSLKASGKYNQYTADSPRIKHFKEYLKNEDVSFNDVTVGCLDNFIVYLRARTTKSKAGKVKKLSERSIMNHLSAIRSVFAFARRQEAIDGRTSPFGKDKIVIRFPDSKKTGLTADEVQKLENVVLPDPRHHHARNLWLFSFYFAGMRVSDIFRLRWSDFHDGRMYYSMNKNDKGDSLKIPAKALDILGQYAQHGVKNHDLVFPELKGVDLNDEFVVERTIAFKTSAIDKMLRLYVAPAAEVNKKVTMHIPRHTFGKLAGNKIPIKTLQKLYRHSHLSTTAIYQQNFDHDEADNALDTVVML